MMRRISLPFCLLVIGTLFGGSLLALDVDRVALGVVEDRELNTDLVYVFLAQVDGEDVAGGRVKVAGTSTVVCELDIDDETSLLCNLLAPTLNDFCTQFGFGNFDIEIDAAVGSSDTITVFFDPGCTDPIVGFPVVSSPGPGETVPPLPGDDSLCYDCSVPGGCQGDRLIMDVSDPFDDTTAFEFLFDSTMPACWDPGICLPPGSGNTFRISTLQIYTFDEPASTDLGDDIVYTSFYQNANLELFEVAGTVPTTPPAVPAGSGGSFPMIGNKLDASGSSIDIEWDSDSCCANFGSHLVYGTDADLPTSLGGSYGLDGSECAIGTFGFFSWSNVPAVAPDEFLWWLVLANNGSTTEGSWGVDSAGQERDGLGSAGSSIQCSMTTKSVANTCGR